MACDVPDTLGLQRGALQGQMYEIGILMRTEASDLFPMVRFRIGLMSVNA